MRRRTWCRTSIIAKPPSKPSQFCSGGVPKALKPFGNNVVSVLMTTGLEQPMIVGSMSTRTNLFKVPLMPFSGTLRLLIPTSRLSLARFCCPKVTYSDTSFSHDHICSVSTR